MESTGSQAQESTSTSYFRVDCHVHRLYVPFLPVSSLVAVVNWTLAAATYLPVVLILIDLTASQT